MKEALVVQWTVANRDLPPGVWRPNIGWREPIEQDGKRYEVAWWASPWWNPFVNGNATGLPGGTLDGALPGTWICKPSLVGVIVERREDLRVEVHKGPDMTTLALFIKQPETPVRTR